MNILNSDSYYNCIYKAIVVNTETSQDPEAKFRIQIFIPLLQPDYLTIYKSYMESGNKLNNPDRAKFPWAISLVKELKPGNIVYGSFINNDINQYIILGIDAYNPANQNNESNGYLANGQNLLDMTMPIILNNEVSLPINAWPDNISQDTFTKITPYDKPGWSIGLIQWHHARAYDCLFEITKKGNWENNFTDKSLQLFKDLQESVRKGSDAKERVKYTTDFHPTPGSNIYKSIQNMLGSNEGKETQKQYASSDIQQHISNLQNAPYNIQNPAIIIFLTDIMNQYGASIIETKQFASKVDKNDKSIIEQLDEVVNFCKNNYKNYDTYKSRRENTYYYILELEKQGKFNSSNITDLGATGSGQYGIPFKGSFRVSCHFGKAGRWQAGKHTGIDFACPVGTPLVACTSGIVTMESNSPNKAYGYCPKIKADDGNYILYAHCNRVVKSSGRINKGEIIAYSGQTGNCFGAHLHFEIRNSKGGYYDFIDPTPLLGIQNITGTIVGG